VTIQAIETYYAGHHFRSRLEARWANVFNDLGIRWEYEPQGYLVGEQRRPYLPDFHLPDIGWWVEVKGSQDWLDMNLLADAVHPTKGIGPNGGSTNLIILGQIPDTNGAAPLHHSVTRGAYCGQPHRCSEECEFPPALYGLHVFLAIADLERLGADLNSIQAGELVAWQRLGAMPIPVGRPSTTPLKGDLTKPMLHPGIAVGPHLEAAYTLGRCARFEHGETP
jgi:hypothetical protein